MSQQRQVVEALKRQLRARGMTYADLGKRIGISEASVKRIFSRGTFTLDRLEEVCGALETSLFQIAKQAEATSPRDATELNEKQERALAASPALMSFFHQLLAENAPKKKKNEKFLLQLDRLKLVELHPGGRYRLLVNRQVRWLPNGPLMHRYGRTVRDDFFARPFGGPHDLLRFLPVNLTDASILKIRARARKLVEEIIELHALDNELVDVPRHEVALLVGFRGWSIQRLTGAADA